MGEIKRGPGQLNNFNVKGVRYQVVRDGKVIYEYTGNGDDRGLQFPDLICGEILIREKQ